MSTYLFYDIETTGLNTAFDQILHFAAIRTNIHLKELERHSCRIKLRPDIIPSPRAMLTNGISIAEASSGMCEFEAMAYIHRLLNTPGTISMGYNSLGFDDEFLRFSFYRNLLPPYTHQFANGCFRADLFPMTVIFRLYKPGVLIWPETDGKTTLKLEHINDANSLAPGRAHDAMVDVDATVALARRFLKEAKMWDYLLGCFEKKIDLNRAQNLPEYMESRAGKHRLGLMIAAEYGPDQNFQVPVISIGDSIPYANQSLWLRLDLASLQDTTRETIHDATWCVRKKYGEPGILLPPHDRFRHGVSPERWAIVKENKRWIESSPDLFQEIIAEYRNFRYPEIPNLDMDAALYEIGFLSDEDQALCRRFHEGIISSKVNLLPRFSSRETRDMAIRALGRNYSDQIPKRYLRQFNGYMATVNPASKKDGLVDYKGNLRTTPVGTLEIIAKLKDDIDLSDRQHRLVHGLESYIRTNFNRSTPSASNH